MPLPKGVSGNPRGRPPGPLTFADRVRRNVDPDRLIDKALALIDDPKTTNRDRIAAIQFLHGAGWSRPSERHELIVGQQDDEPEPDYSQLTDVQFRELEELERRREELLAGVPRALPEVT